MSMSAILQGDTPPALEEQVPERTQNLHPPKYIVTPLNRFQGFSINFFDIIENQQLPQSKRKVVQDDMNASGL